MKWILLKRRLLHRMTNQSGADPEKSFEPVDWLLYETEILTRRVARILGNKDHFTHFICNYLSDKIAARSKTNERLAECLQRSISLQRPISRQ